MNFHNFYSILVYYSPLAAIDVLIFSEKSEPAYAGMAKTTSLASDFEFRRSKEYFILHFFRSSVLAYFPFLHAFLRPFHNSGDEDVI